MLQSSNCRLENILMIAYVSITSIRRIYSSLIQRDDVCNYWTLTCYIPFCSSPKRFERKRLSIFYEIWGCFFLSGKRGGKFLNLCYWLIDDEKILKLSQCRESIELCYYSLHMCPLLLVSEMMHMFMLFMLFFEKFKSSSILTLDFTNPLHFKDAFCFPLDNVWIMYYQAWKKFQHAIT
jgi:hypothetical protein